MITNFDPLKIPNQLKKGPPLKHPCCVKVQHPWKNGYFDKIWGTLETNGFEKTMASIRMWGCLKP